jgi:hypothetical protein
MEATYTHNGPTASGGSLTEEEDYREELLIFLEGTWRLML